MNWTTKGQGLNYYNLEKKYEFIHDQQLFDDKLRLLEKVQGNALALFNSEGPAGTSMSRKTKEQGLNCYNLKKTYEVIHSDEAKIFSKNHPLWI